MKIEKQKQNAAQANLCGVNQPLRAFRSTQISLTMIHSKAIISVEKESVHEKISLLELLLEG